MAELGCDDGDQMLVLWNNAPGAVVLIERLLERIQALELQIQLIPSEAAASRRGQKNSERADISADS